MEGEEKRDFFDVYFILKKFSIHDLLSFFSKKFGEEKLIIVLKSMTYFEDAETDNEPELLGKKVSWSDVKKELLKKLKEIKF